MDNCPDFKTLKQVLILVIWAGNHPCQPSFGWICVEVPSLAVTMNRWQDFAHQQGELDEVNKKLEAGGSFGCWTVGLGMHAMIIKWRHLYPQDLQSWHILIDVLWCLLVFEENWWESGHSKTKISKFIIVHAACELQCAPLFGTASSQDAVAMDSLLGDVQTGHFIFLVLRCREVAVKNLATAEASLQSGSVSGVIRAAF